MPPRRRNPYVSVAEVLTWVLFAALLFPVGFAGWAVGHYTSLGKPSATRTVTVAAPAGSAAPAAPAPATTAPATTAAPATKPPAGASAAAGKAVFASAGCAACHTFTPAGASGKVGPDLDKLAGYAAKAKLPLAEFAKRAIVSPPAPYVPPGFPKGVMPSTFGKTLSAKQLADLVAFLTAGAK